MQARQHSQFGDIALRERHRTTADETEDAPLLPDHMCENEAELLEWRADRLGDADLEFADILPPRPGWLEQAEYEERTNPRARSAIADDAQNRG